LDYSTEINLLAKLTPRYANGQSLSCVIILEFAFSANSPASLSSFPFARESSQSGWRQTSQHEDLMACLPVYGNKCFLWNTFLYKVKCSHACNSFMFLFLYSRNKVTRLMSKKLPHETYVHFVLFSFIFRVCK
jgi:hypothetical protein